MLKEINRVDLDAAFALKFPEGKFVIRTTVIPSWVAHPQRVLLISCSHEFYRSAEYVRPAATLLFYMPATEGDNLEDWDAIECVCPESLAEYKKSENMLGARVEYSGVPVGYAGKTYTYAHASTLGASLKRRGAHQKALALVAELMACPKDMVLRAWEPNI